MNTQPLYDKLPVADYLKYASSYNGLLYIYEVRQHVEMAYNMESNRNRLIEQGYWQIADHHSGLGCVWMFNGDNYRIDQCLEKAQAEIRKMQAAGEYWKDKGIIVEGHSVVMGTNAQGGEMAYLIRNEYDKSYKV